MNSGERLQPFDNWQYVYQHLNDMTKLLMFIFSLQANLLICQAILTKDSFFLARQSMPKNYQGLIRESQWLYLGTWHKKNNSIHAPATPEVADLMLFDRTERRRRHPRGKSTTVRDTAALWETVRVYRKIKGRKIISNTDFATQKIVYADSSTLILETKGEKGINRSLYRRQR